MRSRCGGRRATSRRAHDDRALALFLALDADDEAERWLWLSGGRAGAVTAVELWDFDSWHALATRQVHFARETGALVHLQYALNLLSWTHLVAGRLEHGGADD